MHDDSVETENEWTGSMMVRVLAAVVNSWFAESKTKTDLKSQGVRPANERVLSGRRKLSRHGNIGLL